MRSALDFWRAEERCPAAPASERAGDVTRERYAPCAAGSAVELVTIEGGGHAWPGGDRQARYLDAPSPALDASAAIWAFFAQR